MTNCEVCGGIGVETVMGECGCCEHIVGECAACNGTGEAEG